MPTINIKPTAVNQRYAQGYVVTTGPYAGRVSTNQFFTSVNFFANHAKKPRTLYIPFPTAGPPVNTFCYIKSGNYYLFSGITIPQGTTITSATLNTYCVDCAVGGTQPTISFKFDNRLAAQNYIPSTAKQIFTPSNVVTNVTPASAATPTVQIINTGNFSQTGVYNLYPVDVTKIVQALVDANKYSNNDIAVFSNAPNSTTNTTKYGADGLMIYRFKTGNETKAIELSITYEVVTLQPKTTYKFV